MFSSILFLGMFLFTHKKEHATLSTSSGLSSSTSPLLSHGMFPFARKKEHAKFLLTH